jgi:23S rRNA (adenine2503-C2)-methyltransferase
MDLDLLDSTLASAGEPAFRARQVWSWAARGAASYEEMTDLPAALRARLAEEVPFSSLELQREAHASDGTVKALFHTHDGRAVEAVLMRYRDGRRSICVSSQSGCPLTCTFCATGTMKFGRNLTRSEILDQVLHFRRIEPVDHLVYMGMGEPTMNMDNVLGAARRLPDVGITHRRTGISTVGWVPGIHRLTESDMPIRLALSLHAPEDTLRSRIMPVNDRYPLAEVLAACEAYYARRRRQVFIEYLMLDGVNDTHGQAIELAGLLDPRIYKVNLIPYNPTGSVYEGSSRGAIDAFRAVLEAHGLRATVRLTRGARHRRGLRPACGARRGGLKGGPPAAARPGRRARSRCRCRSSRGAGAPRAPPSSCAPWCRAAPPPCESERSTPRWRSRGARRSGAPRTRMTPWPRFRG